MASQVLKQVIKHGHVELEIPNGMTAEQAIESYKASYPELAYASLTEGEIVDGKVIYEVSREQKVGTKG